MQFYEHRLRQNFVLVIMPTEGRYCLFSSRWKRNWKIRPSFTWVRVRSVRSTCFSTTPGQGPPPPSLCPPWPPRCLGLTWCPPRSVGVRPSWIPRAHSPWVSAVPPTASQTLMRWAFNCPILFLFYFLFTFCTVFIKNDVPTLYLVHKIAW